VRNASPRAPSRRRCALCELSCGGRAKADLLPRHTCRGSCQRTDGQCEYGGPPHVPKSPPSEGATQALGMPAAGTASRRASRPEAARPRPCTCLYRRGIPGPRTANVVASPLQSPAGAISRRHTRIVTRWSTCQSTCQAPLTPAIGIAVTACLGDGRYWARTSDPQLVELVQRRKHATTNECERLQPCGFAGLSRLRVRMAPTGSPSTFRYQATITQVRSNAGGPRRGLKELP